MSEEETRPGAEIQKRNVVVVIFIGKNFVFLKTSLPE